MTNPYAPFFWGMSINYIVILTMWIFGMSDRDSVYAFIAIFGANITFFILSFFIERIEKQKDNRW